MEKEKLDSRNLVWLHLENKAYLQGKRQTLATENEVLKNIAWQLGLPTNMNFRWSTTLSYALILLVSLAISIACVIGVIALFESKGIVICLLIAIVLLLCFIYTMARRLVYSITGVGKHIYPIYENLLRHGKIKHGKVIQTYRFENGELRFTFQFLNEQALGSYIANSTATISHSQIVRVLVSNDDNIAIPL